MFTSSPTATAGLGTTGAVGLVGAAVLVLLEELILVVEQYHPTSRVMLLSLELLLIH